MQSSLIEAGSLTEYGTKEFGPIVVAFAFIIAIGGMTAAAIVLCGWRGAKSMGVNLAQRRVEFVCR